MNNPSVESHFTVCHSDSLSSQLSITMKKISYSKYKIGINYNEENKLFKEEKFKVQIGINYNEENKLFKVQNRYQLQWRK